MDVSFLLVGEAGLEPARPQWTLEPESSESTNSTTRPCEPLSLNDSLILAQDFYFVNTKFYFFQNIFSASILSPISLLPSNNW